METHILRNDNEQHKFIELNFLLLRRFFYAKTKFQDFIFTIIMVIVMVYAMVCYNIAFDKGVGNDIFLLALHELPIMGVIGFLLEFLPWVSWLKKLPFKHFDTKSTNPF